MSQPALTDALMKARREGNPALTIELAATLRQSFPRAVQGYQIGAAALRETGRTEEAATVLDEAGEIDGDAIWIWIERAHLAQRRGNWAEMEEQARQMRTRFAGDIAGWRLGFLALRQLDRLGEAAKVLGEAAERAPGDEWLLEGAVLLSARQAAWLEAAPRSHDLRAAFPANEHGYRVGLRSLRLLKRFDEMEALLQEAKTIHPAKLFVLTEAAALAQVQDGAAASGTAWQLACAAFPDKPDGYVGAFKAALAGRLLGEAETLHIAARKRFSAAPWLKVQAAELAHAHGRFEEAVRRWAALRKSAPLVLEAYHGGYRSLRQLGRLDDAETLLSKALTRFPQDRWALRESALLARARCNFDEVDRRWTRAAEALPEDAEIALRHALARSQDQKLDSRDWDTTLARLRTLTERFPRYVPGWLEHIRALRFVGAIADAEFLARACVERLPDQPEVWLEYALTAGEDRPCEAVQRMHVAAGRFANHPEVQAGFAKVLAQAGQLDEAEAQYQRALVRFPDRADLLCGLADLAMRRQDWTAALKRLREAQALYPNDARVAAALLDTRAALAEAGVVAADPVPEPFGVMASDGRAQMFLQFESLGGTGQACEFGLVQRAGGVEPLGMLRWMHILPDKLLEGLSTRFEGMGTPTQTVLDFYRSEDPDNPEYRYRDTKLDTRMHTFVFRRDVPQDAMFKQTCRRIAFLRRKLIQDLEAGEKIFVYKINERNLDDAELARLHGAMRSYGDNTLLYVRYADARHPSGTVEAPANGLLVGYISRFNVDPITKALRAPDFPAWSAICRAALALRDRAAAR